MSAVPGADEADALSFPEKLKKFEICCNLFFCGESFR